MNTHRRPSTCTCSNHECCISNRARVRQSCRAGLPRCLNFQVQYVGKSQAQRYRMQLLGGSEQIRHRTDNSRRPSDRTMESSSDPRPMSHNDVGASFDDPAVPPVNIEFGLLFPSKPSGGFNCFRLGLVNARRFTCASALNAPPTGIRHHMLTILGHSRFLRLAPFTAERLQFPDSFT